MASTPRICSGQLTSIKRSDSDLPRLRAASVVGPSDREANLPEISEGFFFSSLLILQDFTDCLQWESFSRALMVSDVLIKGFGSDSDLMRDESMSGFVTAEPTPPV